MAITIDPERLKQMRQVRGLSQAALGKRARVDKQTIHRLEHDQKPRRRAVVERVANALEVEPGVLTGEKPMPAETPQPTAPPDNEDQYQLNVRVDGQIRNAFSLASLHYKIPVRRIVELAPLLFVLAAEGSLRRRHERVVKLEAMLDHLSHEWSAIPHFPPAAANSSEHRLIVEAEKKSIAARDLFADWKFGSELEDRDDLYEEYEPEKENPFALYLSEVAKSGDEAAIEPWGREWGRADIRLKYVDYGVCWSQAVEVAGGDQRLAAAIYFGLIPIHEMPRELQLPLDRPRTARWTAAGDRQRTEWLREQAEQYSDYLDRIMETRPALLQEKRVTPVLSRSKLIELADGDEALGEKLGLALGSSWRLVDMMPLATTQLTTEERVEWLRLVLDQGEDPVAAHNTLVGRHA